MNTVSVCVYNVCVVCVYCVLMLLQVIERDISNHTHSAVVLQVHIQYTIHYTLYNVIIVL